MLRYKFFLINKLNKNEYNDYKEYSALTTKKSKQEKKTTEFTTDQNRSTDQIFTPPTNKNGST